MEQDVLKLFTSFARSQVMLLNFTGTLLSSLADKLTTEEMENVTAAARRANSAYSDSLDLLDELMSKHKAKDGQS